MTIPRKQPSELKWQCDPDDITRINTEIIVHRFEVGYFGDNDTAVIQAGEFLWAWERSEPGVWVMEHAIETPRWETYKDICNWTNRFAVMARLWEPDITYFKLKFT
jgi:hypothetical protein